MGSSAVPRLLTLGRRAQRARQRSAARLSQTTAARMLPSAPDSQFSATTRTHARARLARTRSRMWRESGRSPSVVAEQRSSDSATLAACSMAAPAGCPRALGPSLFRCARALRTASRGAARPTGWPRARRVRRVVVVVVPRAGRLPSGVGSSESTLARSGRPRRNGQAKRLSLVCLELHTIRCQRFSS